jgi:hypothetical protein
MTTQIMQLRLTLIFLKVTVRTRSNERTYYRNDSKTSQSQQDEPITQAGSLDHSYQLNHFILSQNFTWQHVVMVMVCLCYPGIKSWRFALPCCLIRINTAVGINLRTIFTSKSLKLTTDSYRLKAINLRNCKI